MTAQDRIAAQPTPETDAAEHSCPLDPSKHPGEWFVESKLARRLEQRLNYLMEVLNEMAVSSWYGEHTRRYALEALTAIREQKP